MTPVTTSSDGRTMSARHDGGHDRAASECRSSGDPLLPREEMYLHCPIRIIVTIFCCTASRRLVRMPARSTRSADPSMADSDLSRAALRMLRAVDIRKYFRPPPTLGASAESILRPHLRRKTSAVVADVEVLIARYDEEADELSIARFVTRMEAEHIIRDLKPIGRSAEGLDQALMDLRRRWRRRNPFPDQFAAWHRITRQMLAEINPLISDAERKLDAKRGRRVPHRDQVASEIARVFRKHDVPLMKTRNGAFAAVLTLAYDALGIETPRDIFRDIKRAIDATS